MNESEYIAGFQIDWPVASHGTEMVLEADCTALKLAARFWLQMKH